MLAVLDVAFNDERVAPHFKYAEKGIRDPSVRLIAQSPTILFAKELKKQEKEKESKRKGNWWELERSIYEH